MSPDWRWPVSTGRGRGSTSGEGAAQARRSALGASWPLGRGELTDHSFAASVRGNSVCPLGLPGPVAALGTLV